jgi:hypothetical protein
VFFWVDAKKGQVTSRSCPYHSFRFGTESDSRSRSHSRSHSLHHLNSAIHPEARSPSPSGETNEVATRPLLYHLGDKLSQAAIRCRGATRILDVDGHWEIRQAIVRAARVAVVV